MSETGNSIQREVWSLCNLQCDFLYHQTDGPLLIWTVTPTEFYNDIDYIRYPTKSGHVYVAAIPSYF